MIWSIELDREAKRDLDKLDPSVRNQIFRFLFGRLAKLDNPRSIAEALKGTELGDFWKYRVGDYRMIASIEDRKVQILTVRVGNRREVYRKEWPGLSADFVQLGGYLDVSNRDRTHDRASA